MVVIETAIPDVKIIEPAKFGDQRGFFSEIFNYEKYKAAGIDLKAVQDNHSLSGPRGTVRGLHFQAPPHAQAKLVRVVRGSVLDVAVDIRRGSPTYGEHVVIELSAKAWNQVYIPKGFAHGFCTLEADTEFLYKVDGYYAPDHDKGLAWDDPALAIDWRVPPSEAVLSDKDRQNPMLSELGDFFFH